MAKPKLALIPCTQGYFYSSVLPSDGSGDFKNGTTDWTAVNANIYTLNNQLVVDDTQNLGNDSRASQIFTTEIGKKYKLTFDRISTTSSFWLAVGSSTVYQNIFRQQLGTGTGTYELEFVAITN